MPSVDVTALLVGPAARPKVETFVALVTELWEEDIVTHRAVVSVGPVTADNVVASADRVGEGRVVAWQGTDLAGLLEAVRAGYAQDLAVWFPAVDVDAFEPADEEESEDLEDEDEDEGDDDDDDDDDDEHPETIARAAGAPSSPATLDLDEFDMVAPTLCLYTLRNPIPIEERSDYVKTPAEAKRLRRFGPCAAWATLDGEDVRYLVDDLVDSWLRDVVEDALGPVKLGKHLW